MRINILAAICSAASAGMWFLITERMLVGWFPERWQRVLGGVLARADRRDGVHRVESVGREREGVHGVAGRHRDHLVADDPLVRRPGRLARRIGCSCSSRTSADSATRTTWRACCAAPAVGLAVLVRRPRTIFRWKLLLACFGAIVLGLTPFATQPIRAAYFPAINEGEPTACRTKLEALVHVLEGHVRRVRVQLQPRPVRQARPERPPGVVPGADRDVVALLQVAVDPRRARRPPVRAGAARRGVPRARPVRRLGALQT